MKLLDKLERKFKKFYIHNLMLYIVMTNAIVYFLMRMDGFSGFINSLALFPSKVLEGEVWRLLTFIFIPPNGGLFTLFFSLYFYYIAGSGLEHEWGGFKFNMYYLCGMIATILVSFATGIPGVPTFINLSLFLAFARINPDMEVLLFFLIPLKIKYLAWFNWAIILYQGFMATMDSNWGMLLYIVAPVLNFFLFFGKDLVTNGFRRGSSIKRKAEYKSQSTPKKDYFHKCTVCGITDVDDPDMEFRYCSKCSGKHGYCKNHINDHEHITE
ncbi:MAG: rhomboid family intramembrane serine protease [Clostridium sp.]